MNREKLLLLLDEIDEYVRQVPPGPDVDCDEDNLSPEDMAAHVLGIICKKIEALRSAILEMER